MKSLEWRDVGVDAIRLRAENSKNKKPRVLPLRGELAEIGRRAKDTRKPECPFVFHDNGQPIGDFRKAWHNACVSAGLGYFEKVGRGTSGQESLPRTLDPRFTPERGAEHGFGGHTRKSRDGFEWA